MQSPFTLPIMAASLLVAAAVGVHLGESSIGLINPIYFQPAPLHPRDRGVAIDESTLRRAPPAQAELYGWEQGYAARAADCLNCEALQARDAHAYSARVPYFGSDSELRTAVAEARSDLGDRYAQAPVEVSARFAQAERYARYPVERSAVEHKAVASAEPEYFEFKEPPAEGGAAGSQE